MTFNEANKIANEYKYASDIFRNPAFDAFGISADSVCNWCKNKDVCIVYHDSDFTITGCNYYECNKILT